MNNQRKGKILIIIGIILIIIGITSGVICIASNKNNTYVVENDSSSVENAEIGDTVSTNVGQENSNTENVNTESTNAGNTNVENTNVENANAENVNNQNATTNDVNNTTTNTTTNVSSSNTNGGSKTTKNTTTKNTAKANTSTSTKTETPKQNNTNTATAQPSTSNTQLQSSDLFAKYYNQAEATLKNMTLEEKVGQMFLVRFPDTGVIEQIKNYNPGGYVLFGKDFKNETKTSILAKIQQYQNASKVKLALAVDEEGGTVVRVSAYKQFRSTKFLSPQQIWKNGKLDAIIQDSTEKSNLLKSIGLNMNLAPVVDVPTKATSFIYNRSYGRGAQETATYASQLIKNMNKDNMISAMKHFPGYGDNVDTHTGIAVDERPYSTFTSSDFLPFKSGIAAGGPCILVNHNIIKSMDASKPASLSVNVHNILRNDLKFSGIIVTDDLAMGAVKKYAENGEAAVQAVLAGNDMIISSDFVKQKNEVLNAVKQGKISESLINNAVKRILAWKYMYKI